MEEGAIKQLCVVGLDGVPCTLLERLTSDGTMPNMAALRRQMPLRAMRASIPEISAVSWTTFATGVNPGVHDIFGFIDLEPMSYDYRFPNALDRKAATIWDRVGGAGGRSIIINQPFTWPVRRMDGVLLAGFVALDLERGVWPKTLLEPLKQAGYTIDIDTRRCREDSELLWQQLDETLRSRRMALDLLWPEDWTYFQIVVTGTDRLFHYLWPALENEDHPEHGRAMAYMSSVDSFVGEVWGRWQTKAGATAARRFVALSDHGFCGITSEVYLNRWLQEEGYLSFTTTEPTDLKAIHPASRAFCLDPGRIYLHSSARFPGGSVKNSDLQPLAEEIAGKLSKLKYVNNEPVIRAVFHRGDIYRGPVARRGPDLVALAHNGFDLKGTPAASSIFGTSGLTGMHTWDDAFVLSGMPVEEPAMIRSLAGTILDTIGIKTQ